MILAAGMSPAWQQILEFEAVHVGRVGPVDLRDDRLVVRVEHLGLGARGARYPGPVDVETRHGSPALS